MNFKVAIWKIICLLILTYVITAGFLFSIPELDILHESIRNLYFHVPMWFGMVYLFTTSLVFALRYLLYQNEIDDIKSVQFANVGIFFGILGITTGMLWAQFTWGSWWSFDPKQNGAAIALLIYLAYAVLRNSIEEHKTKARISAVYNVFAFAAMIPLIFILPRLTDSLHPGSGGNPGFNAYDLDSTMRLVFYPAVIGWAMLGHWLVTVKVRISKIENTIYAEGE